MAQLSPTLAVERSFMDLSCRFVAGVDEVGRGALAGPVSVGMVVVDATLQRPLAGVKDSKLLSVAERERLVPLIEQWCVGHAVGHASAAEIDSFGIMTALQLAGSRAWQQLLDSKIRADVVLLDGNHDWLSAQSQNSFFDEQASLGARVEVPVRTMIKADLRCLSVAAASVLAKVERDAVLTALDQKHSQFGWKVNKGYATVAHRAAIARYGATDWHRKSWRLTNPAVVRLPSASGKA